MDNEFDLATNYARSTRPLRILIIVFASILMGLTLGWRVSGGLTALLIFTEGLSVLTERPSTFAATRPRLWLMLRLGCIFITSCTWTAMAPAYWFSGHEAFRIVAIIILASHLMTAIGDASASAAAAFTYVLPPAATLLVLPVGFGRFNGSQRLALAIAIVLSLAYLTRLTRETVKNARALRSANARLVDKEQDLRAQTEKATIANQAKSRFLAVMSHELRTPMNGILGMARALSQTSLDRRQQDHVDMLVRSGDGLMVILNDLLDISKVEAGKLELEQVPFDLHEVGQRVHDLWTDAASAKGVRLTYAPAFDGPWWVSGDPTRLRQVMVNLVSNALKFTVQGEVRLSICRLGADDGEERVQIAVSDTGIGLTEEQASRLFMPFVQADASTTRRFGGTGLGLSICHELVTLMGGSIEIESRAGEGSRFHFKLGLPAASAIDSTEVSEDLDDLDGLHILLADDNPINLAVARAIMEAVGATVTTAGDGKAALEALRAGAFDAVLMDVHMPVMDGIEALGRLRSGAVGPTDVPVIALTADAMAGMDAELLAYGFDAVEPKPIVPASLLATVSGLVARSRASGANQAARVPA